MLKAQKKEDGEIQEEKCCKKKYACPQLTAVNLLANEVLSGGCKNMSEGCAEDVASA